MRLNLQLKIFFSFFLIIVLVLTVVYFVANKSTATNYGDYVMYREKLASQQIASQLNDYYLENHSWKNVEKLIRQISASGFYVVLSGSDGKTIAKSGQSNRIVNYIQGTRLVHQSVYLTNHNSDTIAMVYVAPTEVDALRTPAEESFIDSVNKALLPAALLAIGLGLALSLLLSGYISGPIRLLTSKVQDMAAGNLDQQIEGGASEIKELAKSFNHLARSLKEAEVLRRNMTSDIAHELRTPLATLQVNIEGMADGVIKPTKKNLDSIHEEITLLARIVSDLQDLSLLEAGKLSLKKQPTDIGLLVQQMVNNEEAELKEIGVSISAKLASDLSIINVDPDRLKQVLKNLITNAKHHTPKKGQITVEVGKNGAELEFIVIDNGKGISEKDLEQIFDRFWRAEKSRSRKFGGAGLGLTIVKRLVEAHGGKVWVTSRLGQGTKVYFTIPS